ncbi:MAG: arsenite methyltransferase [Nitriliruptorales bacterium]|nr:arsenite methyltransferase [Nitriliruptorales bacterium]
MSTTDARLPTHDPDTVHAEVQARYATAATRAAQQDPRCCEAGSTDSNDWGQALYPDTDRAELPEAAVLASLGCGNPTAVADLHPGEIVLDLGSGGGIDVLLSARRVGPQGKAYGLDMTEEMLALARRNATEAGATNVEFLKGHIEEIPLPAATTDVIISNCVINLAADKQAVFGEMARVLKPGGRIGISDVVAEDHLTPADRAERGDFSGCIAGALSVSEYHAGLARAGFSDVDINLTNQVGDGMHSAIIRATLPASAPSAPPAAEGSLVPASATAPEARTTGGACCDGCC